MAKINLGLNVGKKNLDFFFFGWGTNWAQFLNGARGAQLGWVRATGLALRVGSGYEKIRPEPDPLPFLHWGCLMTIFNVISVTPLSDLNERILLFPTTRILIVGM